MCYNNFAFISTYDSINCDVFAINLLSLDINLLSITQYHQVFLNVSVLEVNM